MKFKLTKTGDLLNSLVASGKKITILSVSFRQKLWTFHAINSTRKMSLRICYYFFVIVKLSFKLELKLVDGCRGRTMDCGQFTLI